jgi:hypothetical protein
MKTGWGILRITALVAVMLPAAGCSEQWEPLDRGPDRPPAGTVCPAIGYVSTISVHVKGDTEAVNEVQLCTDEGCSAPGPTAAPAPSVAVSDHYVPLPDGGFSPVPEPSIPPPTYPTAPFISSKEEDGGKWTFFPSGARNSTPDRVSLRALAADRTVLAEQENDLVWTKDDPTNPCGSPVTTPPIELKVPGA